MLSSLVASLRHFVILNLLFSTLCRIHVEIRFVSWISFGKPLTSDFFAAFSRAFSRSFPPVLGVDYVPCGF